MRSKSKNWGLLLASLPLLLAKALAVVFAMVLTEYPVYADVHGDDTLTQTPPLDDASATVPKKMDSRDHRIVEQIRHDLLADKSLSPFGQSVNVLSQDGVVTLTGPVRSELEQNRVIKCVQNIVGTDNVVNKMKIADWKK